MANPEALPFFAMSLLMGFAVGLLSTYLFLYLDELSECTCGVGTKQVVASAADVGSNCGSKVDCSRIAWQPPLT